MDARLLFSEGGALLGGLGEVAFVVVLPRILAESDLGFAVLPAFLVGLNMVAEKGNRIVGVNHSLVGAGNVALEMPRPDAFAFVKRHPTMSFCRQEAAEQVPEDIPLRLGHHNRFSGLGEWLTPLEIDSLRVEIDTGDETLESRGEFRRRSRRYGRRIGLTRFRGHGLWRSRGGMFMHQPMRGTIKPEFGIGGGVKDIEVSHNGRPPVQPNAVIEVAEQSFAAGFFKATFGDAQSATFLKIGDGEVESGAGFGAVSLLRLSGNGDAEVAERYKQGFAQFGFAAWFPRLATIFKVVDAHGEVEKTVKGVPVIFGERIQHQAPLGEVISLLLDAGEQVVGVGGTVGVDTLEKEPAKAPILFDGLVVGRIGGAHLLDLPVGIGNGLNHSFDFFIFCHSGTYYTKFQSAEEKTCGSLKFIVQSLKFKVWGLTSVWCGRCHAYVKGCAIRMTGLA